MNLHQSTKTAARRLKYEISQLGIQCSDHYTQWKPVKRDKTYLGRKERQFDVSQQLSQVLTALGHIMLDPHDERVEDRLLVRHVDVLTSK